MDTKLKKEELTKRFNDLEAEKQVINQRLNEIVTEELRLQGEFRLLDEMGRETDEQKGTN
jgi:predicted nuclease with TOPRIM domain